MNTETATQSDNRASAQVDWISGMQFDAGRSGAPVVRIDGDGKSGPGPFEMLLSAIATCASTDIVMILEKQRTPLQSLRVTVDATRAAQSPRRLVSAVLRFAINAPGATRLQIEKAVGLSIEKYCSVRASLSEDATITWTIDLV